MLGLPIFRKSDVTIECDECDARFDVVRGGVCMVCSRILCFTHLHGSWVQRLRVDLGGRTVCVRCRAGQ
jgi:hypothetical protein